ncbi:MAG: hypothetical protein AAB652_00460 [Patescibacteria group bacterium]
MSLAIHARKRKGGWRYRIWRTSIDAYLTGPLSEEQLRDALLLEEFLQLVNHENILLPQSLDLIRTEGQDQEGNGTDGPWEREHFDKPSERAQREIRKRISRARQRLEYLLAHWDTIVKL